MITGETIYKSMGAIVGFSVIVLLIQNFIGEKQAQYTVLFTLIGMLLINSDKIVSFAKKIGGNDDGNDQ